MKLDMDQDASFFVFPSSCIFIRNAEKWAGRAYFSDRATTSFDQLAGFQYEITRDEGVNS